MERSYIFLLAIALSSTTFAALNNRESEYIKSRDEFIDKFKNNTPPDAVDTAALTKLEEMLKSLIGPIKLDSKEQNTKINLATLKQDLDLGLLDGLSIEFNKGNFIVTTSGLFENFIKRNLPAKCNLNDFDSILPKTFYSDSTLTTYASLNDKHPKAFDLACTFLTLRSQDFGPFAPQNLILYAKKKSLIFLVNYQIDPPLKQIDSCIKAWGINGKQSRINKHDKASEIKTSSIWSEDKAFSSYKKCYANEFKKLPQYDSLKSVADKFLNSIR